MRFAGRMFMMSVLFLGLVACGSLQSVRQNPVEGYPFRHNAFDLKVAWQTSRVDKNLLIGGLLKNVRFVQMEDVELGVSVLDKAGKTLGSDKVLLLPSPILKDEYTPFSLKFENLLLSQGDILRFQIRYRANDGDRDSFDWLSNFKADAVTGATISDEVAQPGRW